MLEAAELSELEDRFDARRKQKAEVFWSKRRHRRQVRRIAELLPEHGTFVDVGAYLGNVTAHVRDAKPCRALLFEPVVGHYAFCCKRFSSEDDVVVENLALSDSAGEATIHRGHKNLAWNTMIGSMANRRNTLLPPQPVRCINFDEYFRDKGLECVDFVKIDVEGYEWRVLAGMRETLARFRPHLDCEIHFGKDHPEWEEQAASLNIYFNSAINVSTSKGR